MPYETVASDGRSQKSLVNVIMLPLRQNNKLNKGVVIIIRCASQGWRQMISKSNVHLFTMITLEFFFINIFASRGSIWGARGATIGTQSPILERQGYFIIWWFLYSIYPVAQNTGGCIDNSHWLQRYRTLLMNHFDHMKTMPKQFIILM